MATARRRPGPLRRRVNRLALAPSRRAAASACCHANMVAAFKLAGVALSFDNSAVAATFVLADAFDM
ncbi:hypothetical protein I551_4531 [Mycobacterium ulcerans str. Harvey]|uniref:Uncharacterized protein n=1 Tax=Mycobacterium ulcerans str. Harvey TaxID=1299332 RepID=A0ABN0QWE9_MYCUL|nr:hypothetical protein I551_4531 [Mycobacterium ulcerans str. Harvey]